MSINFNLYIQWIAILGVFLLLFQGGISIGWISPNLARLASKNSTITMTNNELSWLMSYYAIGCFFGAIGGSVFIEFFGSKKTILLTFGFFSISWLCLIIFKNVELLYASRFLAGVSYVMVYCCFSLYLAEVSVPRIRGTSISITMCGYYIGIVIGSIMETYLPKMTSTSIYLAQCIGGIVLFSLLPNSPYHLVKVSNLEDARKSVILYYADCEVEKELNAIKNFVEVNAGQNIRQKLGEFKSPTVKMSTILIIILYTFTQMTGVSAIMSYMEILLINGKSYLIEPHDFVIYANITSVVSTAVTVKLIDIIGRRFLIVASSIGTAIALSSLGAYYYLLQMKHDAQNIQWLPIASILMYLIFFSSGLGVVPHTVLSEIFPSNIKSIAVFIANLTTAILAFIILKNYQPMIDSIGEAYTFWIYAAFTFLTVPCVLYLLPETKGKSLQEIQDYLMIKK